MTACLVVDENDSTVSPELLHEIHNPDAGRVVVLADPDRKPLTILQDVLLGIGPDRHGKVWVRDVATAKIWVTAWLAGRRVSELVVAHADALTEVQLTELLSLAQSTTRVWLLLRKPPIRWLVERAEKDQRLGVPEVRLGNITVETFIAHFELDREIPTRLPGTLSVFPKVPLDGILGFRGSCHRLLSPQEFRIVDSLVYRSCCEAAEQLPQIKTAEDPAWAYVEPVLAHVYPADAAIAALRGYQMTAFVNGLHLTFETHHVYAQLNARFNDDRSLALLLMADVDPAGATMLILEGLGLSSYFLSDMSIAKVEADGRRVRAFDDSFVDIPEHLVPIVATHLAARLRETAGKSANGSPLFAKGGPSDPETRLPLSDTAIRGCLETAAKKLGVGRVDPMQITPDQFALISLER